MELIFIFLSFLKRACSSCCIFKALFLSMTLRAWTIIRLYIFQLRYCNLTFTHICSSVTWSDERGRSIPPGGLKEKMWFFRIEFHEENDFLSHLDISSSWSLEDDFMTQNRWIFFLFMYCSLLRQVKNSCVNSCFLIHSLQHTTFFLNIFWVFGIPIWENDYFVFLKTKFIHFLAPFRQSIAGRI